MGVNKKKRTPKVSKGIHGGGGKTSLGEVQKVLMGKGRFRTFLPIGTNGRKNT